MTTGMCTAVFLSSFKYVSSEFDQFKGRLSSLAAARYSGRAFILFKDI